MFSQHSLHNLRRPPGSKLFITIVKVWLDCHQQKPMLFCGFDSQKIFLATMKKD